MMVLDMRALFCLMVLLVPLDGVAGLKKTTKPFPGVAYSYVKVYLMNMGTGAVRGPDSMSPIVASDGTYSRAKIGPGLTLPKDAIARLHGVIDRGVQDLLMGLSKCFIPRHGIVYYDAQHEPVAAVSICFECGAIRLFPEPPSTRYDETVNPKTFTRRAEKKLAALGRILRAHDVPVYEERDGYARYLESEKGRAIKSVGQVVTRVPNWVTETLGKQPSAKTIRDAMRGVRIRWTDKVDEASGQRHYGARNADIEFTTGTSGLLKLRAKTNGLVLGNGVRIGMSFEEVKLRLPGYTGLANPAIVMIEDAKGHPTIRLIFEDQSLRVFEYDAAGVRFVGTDTDSPPVSE